MEDGGVNILAISSLFSGPTAKVFISTSGSLMVGATSFRAREKWDVASAPGLYSRASSPFSRPQRSVIRSLVSQRSQSRAAMHPLPAAVMACR